MTVQEFKRKLKYKLWRNLKDYFYDQRIEESALVQNINLSVAQKQKKAVISYVTYSNFIDWENSNIGRTQPYEVLSMTNVLIQLGYAIDIVGYHDTKCLAHIKDKKYDLILGFGETFYQLTELHPTATSVIYMTEQHPDITEREERKRLDYYYERTKKTAKTIRTGNFYWKHHMAKQYSHVITMGELDPFQERYTNPFPFFPTGIQNPEYKFKTKDHDSAKKHFLWFGSYGAIHKGLDILFDVFEKRDDIVLHVAGFYEMDRVLMTMPKKKNIIDHGYIDIMSPVFLDLINSCTYCILPSCSEGCSTGVTTTMRHGLIPIVMQDSGFNRLEDNAIFLNSFLVEDVDASLTKISNLDSEVLARRSKTAFEYAQNMFSIQAYENRFKNIMLEIEKTKYNA